LQQVAAIAADGGYSHVVLTHIYNKYHIIKTHISAVMIKLVNSRHQRKHCLKYGIAYSATRQHTDADADTTDRPSVHYVKTVSTCTSSQVAAIIAAGGGHTHVVLTHTHISSLLYDKTCKPPIKNCLKYGIVYRIYGIAYSATRQHTDTDTTDRPSLRYYVETVSTCTSLQQVAAIAAGGGHDSRRVNAHI